MFTKEAKNQKSSHYIAPYFKALPPTANHNVKLTSQLNSSKNVSLTTAVLLILSQLDSISNMQLPPAVN